MQRVRESVRDRCALGSVAQTGASVRVRTVDQLGLFEVCSSLEEILFVLFDCSSSSFNTNRLVVDISNVPMDKCTKMTMLVVCKSSGN